METLNTLRTNGVKVYRTDEDGTIIATSDGKNITFNVPASETWKVGESAGTESELKSNETVHTSPQSQNEKSANVTEEPSIDVDSRVTTENTYILNTNTKKFHYLPTAV